MTKQITLPDHLISTVAGALAQRRDAIVREAASVACYADSRADRDPEDWLAATGDTSTPEADAARVARLCGEWTEAQVLERQLRDLPTLPAAALAAIWDTELRYEIVRQSRA